VDEDSVRWATTRVRAAGVGARGRELCVSAACSRGRRRFVEAFGAAPQSGGQGFETAAVKAAAPLAVSRSET